MRIVAALIGFTALMAVTVFVVEAVGFWTVVILWPASFIYGYGVLGPIWTKEIH